MRKYVISLAQGSAAFKWARNTVLRKNRTAVCCSAFWHSHVHTRLLHSGATTNSGASGHLSYVQEEWVWSGFQDAYLSVVECQAWDCDISQDCTHTQHTPSNTYSEGFRAFPTHVKPPMWPVGYCFKGTRNLSKGCEDLSAVINQILYSECVGWFFVGGLSCTGKFTSFRELSKLCFVQSCEVNHTYLVPK